MVWDTEIREIYDTDSRYRVISVRTSDDESSKWEAEALNTGVDKELFPYVAFLYTDAGFPRMFDSKEEAMQACEDHCNGAGVLVG